MRRSERATKRTRNRIRAVGIALGLITAALVASASGDSPAAIRDGGTFRIAVPNEVGVTSIEPAIVDSPVKGLLLRPTCAQLLAFPGPRPEVAAGFPKVSRDRLTYTFTIRNGYRFSSGERLTARNFRRAIVRHIELQPPDAVAAAFVGGRDFREGRSATLPGVVARGNTLVLRLTEPLPELLDAIAGGLFCPVPVDLPVDREGIPAPLAGSGPYYIAEFVRGRRVVLARNRFYRGPRPQHVDRFEFDLVNTFGSATQKVANGAADMTRPSPDQLEALTRRYGVNRSRFFTFPSPENGPRLVVLNTQRPLFRNNARLRRAVAFAIDRRAIAAAAPRAATSLTDQFLSPLAAGFRDVRIYPFGGNLRRARALARGRTRSGRAIMYVNAFPAFVRAQAELIRTRLRRIGIEAELREFSQAEFNGRLSTPGEPFDLAVAIHRTGPYPSHSALHCWFDGRTIGIPGCNPSRFDVRRYNRRFSRAARLNGRARYQAYGKLDVDLVRAAPALALYVPTGQVFVSARAGCVRFDRPLYDLARVCLKR